MLYLNGFEFCRQFNWNSLGIFAIWSNNIFSVASLYSNSLGDFKSNQNQNLFAQKTSNTDITSSDNS